MNKNVKVYNNQNTEEFIDAMLLNIPVCKQMLKDAMDKNYERGMDNIPEAFANLRLCTMEDVLNFIKNHKTMTDEDLDRFIADKILQFKE